MRPLYAPRHLRPVARRLQLRRAVAAECARLLKAVESATPDPVDDEPSTAAIPAESMRELVFGRAA